MKTEPVVFENRLGKRLFGVLESPLNSENRHQDIAILILSPGTKMRVGPHRMHRKLSQELVNAGYTVLRFDFYGLGDSEGEVGERDLLNVYNSIQDGRYIHDTLDAMDWFQEQYGFSQFILSGLCGGALTGLLSGCDDSRVLGLIALGLPNIFDGGEANFSRYVTDGQLELMIPGYLDRLKDPASWKRLLTLKSDFRVILKILLLPLKKRLQNNQQDNQKTDLPEELVKPIAKPGSNVNPKFAPAFFKMLINQKQMLLIYSGQDRLGHEFNEKFASPYKAYLDRYADFYDLVVIDNANHILSNPAWEAQMHRYAVDWLSQYFKFRTN